jgi:diaminohydroxyphosphoribosylaminopyrimidine deaminase/5-amino-6-(5-phosphoribosylamino)uracil reductase
MQRAYTLARGFPAHPNPRVGAVIVSTEGQVIGEGAHTGPGERHAEVVAMDHAGNSRGATLYVSLEPCTHQGRTPPCVDRIIAEGVAHVVVGALDPDRRVSGSGVARMRAAGIEVDVLGDIGARQVDPAYFHHRETGLPLVTLKYAMTLDGSVAASDGSSQWVTSEAARDDAHRLRAEHDVVVIGAGTLAEDDPRLDVRLPGYEGRQPVPVIVAGRTVLAADARIWERDPIVVTSRPIETPSGTVLVVAGGADGRPDPLSAARALADAGHLAVLLEGGPGLAGTWWRSGLIGRGVVYIGARIGGGTGLSPMAGGFESIETAEGVTIVATRVLGPDLRIEFEIGC